MTAPLNGIPQIGLGTWNRLGPEGVAVVRTALELGYRHLDTAQSYGSEPTVAEAIRQSGVPRDEVFITSKVADTNLDRDRFLPSVRKSLDDLATDRVDLMLIHWPSARDAVPFEHYVEALGEIQDRGWAWKVGISNFPMALVDRAEAILGPGRLAANQVEVHPYLQNRRLRAHCAAKGIAVTAYMPLAKGRVADDPILVTLAFLMAEGLIVIPSSTDCGRLAGNLAATDIALTAEEMAAVRTLERNGRIIDPEKSPRWDD
jgi:2,5-diketo-D-gluconate reductase B